MAFITKVKWCLFNVLVIFTFLLFRFSTTRAFITGNLTVKRISNECLCQSFPQNMISISWCRKPTNCSYQIFFKKEKRVSIKHTFKRTDSLNFSRLTILIATFLLVTQCTPNFTNPTKIERR